MKGYGAVEMGVHRFDHRGHEDTEGLDEASLIHLWQSERRRLAITRVLRYDHHRRPE